MSGVGSDVIDPAGHSSPARRAQAGQPTIKQLAKLAGVSTTTASDALTGSGRVSARTRERVEAVAAEIGYVPNLTARRLRHSRTGAIGVYLHPSTTHLDYFKVLVMAGFQAAEERDYNLALVGPRDLVDGRLAGKVDGLVISDPYHGRDANMERLFHSGIPVVTIERPDPELPAPTGIVTADHRGVVREMLAQFAAGGARRPAFLMTGDDFPSAWASEVTQAYAEWCAETGTEATIETIPMDMGLDGIGVAIERLFRRLPGMDALFCGRDGLVPAALGFLRERGYTVGQDFALAAGDDAAFLEYLYPPIAAIDLDPSGYVREAIDLLADHLDGTAALGEHRHHRVSFVARRSCRLSRP